MKRTEFIEQLQGLLQEVEQEEKEEALQYYEDYLEEAGILEDTEVPESFGTPQRVAQTVRDGLNGRFEQEAEFTERGFQEFEEQKNQVDSFGGVARSENQAYQDKEREERRKKERKVGLAGIFLIIVAGMIGGPVVFSVLAVIVSLLFCGIIVVGAGIFASVVAGAALLFTGIMLLGLGIVKLFVAPFAGLVLLGSGFISLSIGLLGVIVGIQIGIKILPKVVRKTVEAFRKAFQRRRKERSV